MKRFVDHAEVLNYLKCRRFACTVDTQQTEALSFTDPER